MKLLARTAAAGLAVALAASLAAPATAAPRADERRTDERRTAYRPTLTASSEQVVAQRRFTLKGTVSPARRGITVVLQKKVRNKKWVEEARLRTARKGTFRYRDRPHVAGPHTYRVVVPAAAGVRRGVSDPVTVTVYKWQSLADVQPRRNLNTWQEPEGSIDGVPYAPVIQGNWTNTAVTNGFMDWNLARTCLKLRATLGNGDQGDTGSSATVTLYGDSTELVTRTFGLAQSESGTYDLTDVFRLTFSWSASVGGAQAMLAEPEVLCAM